VKALRFDVRATLYCAGFVGISWAQRENGSTGAEYLFPEMGKGSARVSRVDGDVCGLGFRGGLPVESGRESNAK